MAGITTVITKYTTELTHYISLPLTSLDFSSSGGGVAGGGGSAKMTTVIAAIVTSILLYITTQLFFTLTTALYRELRLKEKVFWNLAVVRSCFGIFSIVAGFWAIFVDTELPKDVVFATSATSHFVISVTAGFFVFECLAVTLSDVYFRTFSCLLQIHHWVALAGLVVALITDAGHVYGCQGLLLEMSTPFSCLCWTLLKAGKEHTLLWKANQFILVHSFHLRNVVELKLWYLTWQSWDNVWNNMPASLFFILYPQLAFVTIFMTPYWTWKKTRQMFSPVDWNFEKVEMKAGEEKKKKKPAAAATVVGDTSLMYEGHENGGGFVCMNGSGCGSGSGLGSRSGSGSGSGSSVGIKED